MGEKIVAAGEVVRIRAVVGVTINPGQGTLSIYVTETNMVNDTVISAGQLERTIPLNTQASALLDFLDVFVDQEEPAPVSSSEKKVDDEKFSEPR